MSFGTFGSRIVLAILGIIALFIVVGTFQHPPVDMIQRGYRGTGMVEVYNPANLAAEQTSNQMPQFTEKPEASGQKAGQAFENVQVLKDVELHGAHPSHDGYHSVGRARSRLCLLPCRWRTAFVR